MKEFNWFEFLVSQPIDILELPKDAKESLIKENLTTIFDLADCEFDKLKAIVGVKIADEISFNLRKIGFTDNLYFTRLTYGGKLNSTDIMSVKRNVIFKKKKSFEELLKSPIEDMVIEYKLLQSLKNAKIFTILDLTNISIDELNKITNLSNNQYVEKMLWEINVNKIVKIMQGYGFVYDNNFSLPVYKGNLKIPNGSPEVKANIELTEINKSYIIQGVKQKIACEDKSTSIIDRMIDLKRKKSKQLPKFKIGYEQNLM